MPATKPSACPEVIDLLDRCPTVPSLPSAYLRLSQALNDPYSSSADFARIIEEDAGLTVRVLRLVNSAMYGGSTKVDSVVRAMAIMGIEPLHDLVLATSAVTAFEDIDAELLDMNEFWRHSLGTAVAARVIGTDCGYENVEALFVGGLLHDVGRVMLCLGNPEGAKSALDRARESGTLVHDAERAELGYDHAQVGRVLLEGWGLPRSLGEPVGCHHRPVEAEVHIEEAAIIHLADITAHALRLGASGEPFVPPVCEFAWEQVGVDNLGRPELLGNIGIQFQVALQAVLQ